MPAQRGILKICKKGHRYYKSTDCPTCPKCEEGRKPVDGFLSLLAAPARRALERFEVTTIQRLSNYTEKEILQLHGMGRKAFCILRKVLKENGLSFNKQKLIG